MTDNQNPGNFANRYAKVLCHIKDEYRVLTQARPKEEVQNIASKGGQASHSGGFASMDPDKQVSVR
jgi:hypothetical protein